MRCVAAALASLGCLMTLQSHAQEPGVPAAAAPAPAPGRAVVIGDSHGEAIAQASGLKGLSRISVHIRGPRALEQINNAPPQSTAFVVLGSNDAEGSIKGLDRYINAIVAAAERKGMKLVWLGPPCTIKAWNSRVRELDDMLAARFAGTAVTYVSMRDDTFCKGGLFDRDGVHFTMKGYGLMWEKARLAAGMENLPARSPAAVASNESGEIRVHRRHLRRVARSAAPAAFAR